MELNQDDIDNLIGKYLAGEATVNEIEVVDRWAKQSFDNKKYFDNLRVIFGKAASVKEIQKFDTDAAWAKMKQSLASQGGQTVGLPAEKQSNFGWVWKIAASIALFLGVGLVVYQLQRQQTNLPLVVTSNNKETVSDTLPDGSKVFLNKSTSVAYTFDKKKKEHVVKLKGEAYFNIEHDDKKNFLIDIDGIYIRDIGTSFNVKAYPDRNTIEVVVESGEVRFYTDSDSGLYLKEKGKAVYNKNTKQFTLDLPEENVLAYKTRTFNFDKMNLGQVVAQLNAVYMKEIVLDKKLSNCQLTVNFNNESQDEIVGVIAETLGLKVTQKDGKILLEGNGCEAQ